MNLLLQFLSSALLILDNRVSILWTEREIRSILLFEQLAVLLVFLYSSFLYPCT